LHPSNKPTSLENLAELNSGSSRKLYLEQGVFMGDQQGKKTGSGQPASPGTTGQQASNIPASGQDKPQGNQASAAAQPKAGQAANAKPGQPMNAAGAKPAGDVAASSNTQNDQPIGEKLSTTASGILDKAKETASGTYDAVANQATTKIEEHKGELSSGLKTLADSFRKTGHELGNVTESTPLTDITARYTGTAANQIEKVASYFERKDLRAMMRDAEGFARRNPAIFLGAAFGLGMLAARFLKSSAPDNERSMRTGINTNLPTALPSGTDRPNTLPTNR